MRSFNQPFSVGMRCRMRYESDDASERRLLWFNNNIHLCQRVWNEHRSFWFHSWWDSFFRCTGIIIGSREAEPMWHGSKWKSLAVYSLLSWFAYKMNADISFNVSSVSMCFQEYDCKQNQCLSPVVLCWHPSWLDLLKEHSFVCNLQVPRILKIWRNKSVTVLIPSKLVLMLKMFNFFFLFCFGYYAINQVLLI